MRLRSKSHWCMETRKLKDYHKLCGGKMAERKSDKQEVAFKEENFTYSKCWCSCHKF